MAQWMDLSLSSNRYIQSYYNGFVDISGGNLYLRGFNTSSNCHLFINNGDISLNGRMYASGDVSINSRLYVGEDASFNNRIFVGGDVSINSRLFVGSDAIIYGRLSVNEYRSAFIINTTTSNYTFILAEDMSLNGRLTVYLDTSMNSRLFVGGDVSLNSRLIVYSDVSFNSRLFLGNDVSLNGSLFVSNYIGLGVSGSMYQLGIAGETAICQLDVSGVSNFRGPVYPLTMVDNSVLLTNNREFDFNNNFGTIWTQNPPATTSYTAGSFPNINWVSIAISATGQNQIACNYGVSPYYNNSFVYISNNYGLNWTQLINGTAFTPYSNGSFKSVAISASGKFMTALQYSSTTALSVYVSNNYGGSWVQASFTTTNSTITTSQGFTFCAMSSTGQYQIVLQTYGAFPNNNVYVSSNYGINFTFTINNSNSNITFSSAAISSNGQYITVCGSYGIYNSNNFGNYWTINTSIPNTNCVALSATGQYQYCGIGGGANTGKIYFSKNYGINWTVLNSLTGNWSSISVTSNGQNVTATLFNGGIYTSNNFGSTWTNTNSGTNYWNCVAMSSNGGYITACQSNYTSVNSGFICNSITPYSNMSVSNLIVCYNDASFNNRLSVGNSTSLGGTVDISGNTTIGTPTVNGFLKVNGTFTVIGNNSTTLGGTLTVTGATTLNNTLNVSGTNTTTLNGATTIANTLTVTGANATTLGGSLTVTGATTLNNTLNVSGTNTTTLNGATTIANTLSVTGANATTLGGSLGVTGATTLAGLSATSISTTGTATITTLNVVTTFTCPAITGSQLANATVGTTQLTDSGVTTAKIADSNVTNDKIANTTITGGKLTADITISTTGTITAASFNATSDYRIKNSIKELNDSFTIDYIRPVEYVVNGNSQLNIGVVAHELQEIYPCLVTGIKDGEEMQSVNYIGLIPIMINEIKNLKKSMKVLKTELENLKNQI